MERTAKLIAQLEREIKNMEIATFGSFDPTEHEECIEYLRSGKLPSEDNEMLEELISNTEEFYENHGC